MSELNGGSDTGSDVVIGVEPLTGVIILARSTWNDHTQAFEIVIPSRVEKTHGMVQQRDRRRDFARSYEQYNSDVAAWDATRRLQRGDDNPADDPEDSVRGDGGR